MQTRLYLSILVILALIAATATQATAQRTQQRFRPMINVSGEGKATAPPDMATIRTGVVSQAATAKEALAQNNGAMQEILDLLKQHDIAAKDVQSSTFNVSPVYDHDNQGQVEPKVTAYRVHNEVQVRVRKLASLGEVLEALVQAGSNQISGISFDVGDPAGILNEARSDAIRDAKSRANVYAQAAGVSVGQVLQISEQPFDVPRPMMLGVAARAAESVPVATGEQEFRVTVNVAYELRQQDGD
jgi:uncharacterized protein YggE